MRPADGQTRRIIAIGISVCLSTGCGLQPSAQPLTQGDRSHEEERPTDDQVELDLTIEVIGTYRNGDAEYVREQIEAILPDGFRNRSWEQGGNHFAYGIPAVADVDALAGQVQFGKVIHVDPHLIRIEYSYDHEVPARFKEEVADWRKAPDDALGPALKKHQGDWWAALGELGATRRRDELGEMIHLRLPSSKVTDETMIHVAELTSLKKLQLPLCRHVTDDGARYLAELTNLEELDLFATSIGNPGQVHLSNLTKLKRLKLSGNGTENGLRHIAGLTGLERLSIGFGAGYPVSTEGLEYLSDMKDLQLLRLDGCEISDDGLRIVAGFSPLTSLSLRKGRMTDAGLVHLAGLAQLHELNLWDCTQVGDDGIAHLRSLENLSHLNLRGTQLTGRGLEHLQSLRNLWTLTLFGTRVADAGFCELEPFPELYYLSLDETEITDTSLEHLKSFPKLTTLCLSDTRITDVGCKHLGEMTGLRTLQIDGTQVTDAGMSKLAELTDLRSLDISNTSITEQGLRHLQFANGLRDIRAEGSGVTDFAVQEFKNRHKNR